MVWRTAVHKIIIEGVPVDADHPILDQPWTYDLIGFNYQRPSAGECYVDITLRRGSTVRRLRFYSPRDIRIDSGFPCTSGLCIVAVADRQMEGIGVEIANYEGASGPPTFFARAVVDLDRQEDGTG